MSGLESHDITVARTIFVLFLSNNAVSKEVLTARTIMLKHSQLEGLEIESLRKDRRRFLELALRHYATALAKDDGQETVVCR